MAATKNVNRFLKKIMHTSTRNLESIPRNTSSNSISVESSTLGSSRRSWGSIADIHYDSQTECSSPPPDVSPGCLAVYVGEERRRFVIPTSYLTNNVFRTLLAKSEEEFGFRCDGGLRIACTPDVFEHLVWSLEGTTSEFFEEAEFVRADCPR